MVPRALIAVSAVPLLLLTACGGGATPGTACPDPTGDWTLVEGTGPEGAIPILPDSPITLTVDGTQWGGVAACNSYSGTFEVEMACRDDVMAAERAYLSVLTSIETVEDTDTCLTLRGSDSELVFGPTAAAVPTGDVADVAPRLVGTTWAIVELVGRAPGGPTGAVVGAPRLRLAADGSLSGTTGCNRFVGRYELAGTALTIGPLATTRMACDEPATRQEHALLRVLADATLDAELAGDMLHLSRPTGGSITCHAAPSDD
jgi:heat shock protein HslJ